MNETPGAQAEPAGLVPADVPDPIASDELPGAAAHPQAGAAPATSQSIGIPTPGSLPGPVGESAAQESAAHAAIEPTAGGDPRVDDALSRLTEVDSLPLPEQVEVYGDIHRRLAGVLSDPDSQA